MTMSRFRQQSRVGHLERLKRIIGNPANFPHRSLRFRTYELDYSDLPHKEYDWQRTVYSGAKKEIPHDIPEPKGKHVTTATYVDVTLHHDQVTGRAVTACLHIVNAAPSHWHTKRQSTVETATLALNFWQSELIQIKSLSSGTLSCILEPQSDPKTTCLVISNL